MATKETTRNENFENSSKKDLVHKRLFTSAQFLLNCFKCMHHSEMSKSICFTLEDIRTFVLEMDSTSQMEAFSNVPSITMDDFGFLKKKASTRLDFNIVTRDEMLLLFVVHNLSLNGKSHFEEVVKDLMNQAPPVISMILSCASVPNKMGYLRQYPQYFRLDDTGHLKLTSTVNLTFKDSSENSGSSFKDDECFKLERKTAEDIDTVEVNQSIKYVSVENELSFSTVNTAFSEFNCIGVEANYVAQKERFVSPTISTLLSEKEFISNRIRSSVFYLQRFFKLEATQKLMCMILRVLEDVEIYFLYSSCADKVDLIQNSFVSSILKDSQPVVPGYNPSAEVVSSLNRQEKELLYISYSINFCGQLHYSELFDTLSAHNKSMPIVITSDSEKLSYFKKFNHLFFIDIYGIVQPCTLTDLHLHSSFMLYIFKSYGTVISISIDKKTTNDRLQSQDIWCKDNLIYKRLCSFVCFLLHSFGTQPCDCLMKCVSYVFPDIGIFLNELTMKEQQELFSSIPCTVLNSDTYLQLTAVYEFDTTYASNFELCMLHIVSNLAFSGETYGMKLVNDFYESVPKELTLLPNFYSAKDPKWCKYLNRSKFWECDSAHYLTLPSSFHFSVDNIDILSQTSKEDPLLIPEFRVSQEELKVLGLPQDILDILAERMVDGIMYLLNFFKLNIHSGFLEVVLHIIKRGSAFFKLPPSYQEEVIKNCFRAFRIDDQGNLTCINTTEMQTCILSITKRLALCMAYIISKEVSMHYRKAIEYYQIFIGRIEIKHVGKELEYFKNRPNIFLVCDSGYVSLVNITAIKFDYISIIMPGKLDDSNSFDTYEEENEVTCSDYIPRVEADVDSFFADNCHKSTESNVHNKSISSAMKVLCTITDSEKAVISNFTKKDNITTLDFDVPRGTFTSSLSNSTSVKELQHLKNTRTNASINALAIKNGSNDATNEISPQILLCNKRGTYKKLCVAVSFLLSAFGPLSCRHLTKCISHVLRTITKILNGLSQENQQEIFSSFPLIMLEEGYLHLINSYKLVIQCLSKSKLRKLFITSYLALNGKTHYMDLLEKLYHLTPGITIAAFKNASNIKWRGYFKNSLKKILKMDSHGYLILLSSFDEIVCDGQVSSESQSLSENLPVTTVVSLGIDKELNASTTINLAIGNISKQDEESYITVEKDKCIALNREFSVLKSNAPNKLISNRTEVPSNKHESKEFQSEISDLKSLVSSSNNGVSQISCAEKGTKKGVTSKSTEVDNISVFKFGANNETLFCPDKISNVGKKSFTFEVKDITTLSTKDLANSNPTNLNTNRNSNLDNLKKDTICNNIAHKEIPRRQIQMYSNEEVKDSGDYHSSLLGNPSGKDVSSEKNATGNVVHQNTVPPTSSQTIDKICTIIREGKVVLFEYFKCPLDFRLACVIFHALHEAKRPFLLLTQSEQIALVEKILASEVEDDSCNRLKLSSPETVELNKEQRDLLFISYVVGQSGKLHFSTLIEMFEKHKMDVSVLMDSDDYFLPRSPFFSLDNDRCIKLENFPPSQWMTERLSFVPLVSPDLSGLSTSQSKIPLIANNKAMFWGNLPDDHSEVPKTVPTNIEALGKGVRLIDVKGQAKEMKTHNVSKYPQGTLNILSDRMYDGVSYLLRFFELNINFDLQHIFDTLLHLAKKCSIFFKLPPTQQEEVIIASFYALRIDEYGRITFAFAKKRIVKLTMVVRMSLCMSFMLRQRGPMHYRKIFKYYHKCVGRTKMMHDCNQFEYFKSRKNIFLVCDRGYVSLGKIPTIELDYVSILMSRRFNSLYNIEEYVKNKGVSDCDNITAVQSNMVPFDEDECEQSSGDIVAETVCPDKPENICSVQIAKVKTEASEEMNSLEKDMTKRVIDSILYLSHCFVMVEKVDLLDMILCVLEDVKTYFSNLTLKNRDYFNEKCFFHNYFLHSKDFKFIFCTEVLSPSCNLNDTEKIMLFVAYLLRRERALHYTKLFDKFPQYNAVVPTCVRSVLNQYKFISKRKNLFSMNSNGIVRLFRTSTESKVTLENNETMSSMSNIPSSDVNDDSKNEIKDNVKQLLEEDYATSKNNETLLESTHGKPALEFHNRIKESVTYLGMTFESVSQEQVMKTVFYVLHDILNLFIDESDFHKNILKEILSLFRKRKNTSLPMTVESTVELAHLTEVEKEVLTLIYIMIHSGPMHYLELFKRFESRGRKVKSMSSRHQYLYIIEKTKYFVTDLKGGVSLNKNHICRNLKLDDFFKNMNLKASFHAAIFESYCNNAPTHTKMHRRKFKSLSGCIRQDALYGIYEICSDILSCFKKLPCITNHLCDKTDTRKSDSSSEFIGEVSTENPANEDATWVNAAKPDLTPNETFNLKGIKPSNVAFTSSSLKENPRIQTDEILPSMDSFNSNWRESAMVPGFSETNNIIATNHCGFVQSTWFGGMNPLSSSDFFEPIPLHGKNEPDDISVETNQSQVYQTITDLNSVQSRSHFCENWKDDPSSNNPRNSFLASAYVDRNSNASSENDNKAVVKRTVAKFNLLELQSDAELFSASAKNADSNAKRIDPNCNCSIDSKRELRTMNFFIIILGQSRIGFSIPTLTKKLRLASKEVQHYISCVYNGKILNFVQNHETFYVSPISGNVCLKK